MDGFERFAGGRLITLFSGMQTSTVDPTESNRYIKITSVDTLGYQSTDETVVSFITTRQASHPTTLPAATDYCNTHKNAGALLFVRRDLTVIPKIIYPATRDVGITKSSWSAAMLYCQIDVAVYVTVFTNVTRMKAPCVSETCGPQSWAPSVFGVCVCSCVSLYVCCRVCENGIDCGWFRINLDSRPPTPPRSTRRVRDEFETTSSW